MVHPLKRYLFAWLMALFAISTSIWNIMNVDYGNIWLRLNPVLSLMIDGGWDFLIDQSLQRFEPSSFIIHYRWGAYVIHLLSYVAVGLIIDLLKNIFKGKKGNVRSFC